MLYESLERRHLLTAAVEGLVFADLNEDGIQNGGESGIEGVTVYADLNTNATRDPGEPFTLTTADDPATPGTNELGRYLLGGLNEQDQQIRVEVSVNTRQTSPMSPATGATLVVFENAARPVEANGSGPRDIQVSPDGQFVIIGWDQGRRVTTFTRRAQDGQLTFQSELYGSSLYGIRRSVFSPNGSFFYAPAEYSDAINVLQMTSSGTLSLVQSITLSDDANLDRVNALAITPDGSQLFVTSTTTKSLLIYDIDPSVGTLTLTQTFQQGVNGLSGLDFPAQPRISPEGTLVAVATQGTGNPLTLLDRDPATGVVTPSGISLSLGSNRDVIFSNDGRFLYVADFNGRLWTLSRDLTTGNVQVLGSLALGAMRLDTLVMRPDQSGIYASSSYTNSLLAFDRDPISGTITLNQTLDSIDVPGMTDAEGIAISPDGQHLYLASQASNRIQTFWTNPTGQTPVASTVTTVSGQSVTNINFSITDASPQVVSLSTNSISPEPADQVEFSLTFDEPVSGVDISDFELITGGLANASLSSVTGGPNVFTVTVATPDDAGQLQVQLIDDDTIVDANGVPIGGVGTGAVVNRSISLRVDSLPPQVIAIAAAPQVAPLASQLSFFVTFDEPVIGVDVTDFQTVVGGSSVASLERVAATGDASVYRVDVNVSGGVGSVAIALIDDDTIVDLAANALGDVGVVGNGDGSFQSSAVVIDNALIRGRVWTDMNADGLLDAQESGRGGITVFADTNGNGSRGPNEPAAITQNDDPTTTDIDEAGMYELNGLASGVTYELRVDAPQYRQTSPVSYAQDDGNLTFADSIFGGVNTSDSLYSVDGITITNDGKQLYALSPYGNKVGLFTRTSVSDPFVFESSWSDTSPGFSGLGSPSLLIFTPEEQFGYLIEGNKIYVIDRNSVSGELSVAGTVSGATSEDSSFQRISSAAISPDGQYLYTTGTYSDTLSVYRIDAVTGMLQPIQELRQGVDGVQGLDYPDYVQVSPDGSHLFVHSFFKASLTIYAVTPGSGRLVESQFFSSIPSSSDIVFSPDGNFAYSASVSSAGDKIHIFALINGQWTKQTGMSIGLNAPRDLEISRDGRFIYAADSTLDAIAVFSRDIQTGALTPLQTLLDVAPHDSLNGVEFIKLSPDGRELFAAAASDHSLTRFIRLNGSVTADPIAVTTTFRQTTGVDFGVRSLFPSIVELSAQSPGPISTSTVLFRATFDEPVTGVQTGDFVVESTGITGASVVEVTGGPSEYDVLVDTGVGDGTLQVRLIDDDTIVNTGLYPLGGSGNGNGEFLSAAIAVIKSGSIAGRLVFDLDEDGYADLTEQGIAGATVIVDRNSNGLLDPDEPFAFSVDDDPDTPDMNEAGSYFIPGVEPGQHSIVVVPPPGFQLTNPAKRATPITNTTYVRAIKDGTLGANYLDEAAGVTTSPDGNFLYVASYNDDSVTVFSRNAADGQLTVVQQVVNNVGGVTGLLGAQSIAITRDGENLYVASALDSALVMFDRDPATGQLTYLGRLKDGIGGVDGLNQAVGVQVSNDGHHLYVAAITDGSVSLFTRDPSTGLVTFTQRYVGNTSGAFAAELSPDQRHVYVSGSSSSAITVYERDAVSGALTLKQTIRQTDASIDGLSGVSGMSLSPDGKNLYAAGYYSDKVAVFERDLATGMLSLIQTTNDPNGTSAARPISVLASPDGHHVVAMYEVYDAIEIYSRDQSTGELTLLQQFRDVLGSADGLNGAWDAEFSNDGDFLYVVGAYDDAVVIFNRNAGAWIAVTTQTNISTGSTTVIPDFAAMNVAPRGVAIQNNGVSPVTSDTIEVTITFSEPVVGFDAADIHLGGTLTSASVTGLDGSGDNYTATIALGAEQGTLIVTVTDNGSIDDLYGLDLGGPAIGDGSFSSAAIDVDLLVPIVDSIENVYTDMTSIRRTQFQVNFSEPVTQVDGADFQIISSGLSDVTIESVSGAGTTYTVIVTNTSGTGTLALRLIDDDSIVDNVGLPLGGTGLGNGDFSGTILAVEPAVAEGKIFHDIDDDGYQDAAEPGIAGITVYIDQNANSIRDAGEPFAITSNDDPASINVDEAGLYSITTDQTGPTSIAIDVSGTQYLQTSPRTFTGGTGFLSHQQTITTDPLLATVFGNYGVRVSPDGNFVVLQVTDDGGGLAVFRQHSGGNLESLHWYPAGSLTDLGDPQSPTFSPTGEFLYVYAKQSKQLQTYGFDLADGSLTLRSNLDLSGVIAGNFVSLDVRISPDGKNLYATAYTDSTLRVFGIEATSGTVSLLQTFNDWGDTPRLQNASGVTVSPDGRHVYAGSFAEHTINAFERSPIDGTLTKIQELPDVRRPSRLLSSSDGLSIIVTGWDTFNGQDLTTLVRDPATGLLSVLSRRVLPATPEGASLAPDGTSLHYADDDYANLNTLSRDPATGTWTALQVLTDDVDVPGMRGVDDTATSPDGKYLYAVNGYERNLHRFTRDQGVRSETSHLTTLGFGGQNVTFDFGILNPPPTVVSVSSDQPDPTSASSATITIQFSESVMGFDRNDLSFTAATLLAFPTATIDSVDIGPASYSVAISGLSGSGQVELVLNDDDSVVDTLGAPLGGSGMETYSLVTFAVDNVAPSVVGWLPAAGATTVNSTLAFTVTFDEPVQNVDVNDFQLDTIGITGASIIDVIGSADTYTINVNTGSGDGTLTLRLVDNDSITDMITLPLGGVGLVNGDSSSSSVLVTKTGTIEGTLWHDANGNGWQNQSEPGIAGVTVYLDLNDNGQFDAATEPSTITDADDPATLQYDEAGRYQFFSVDPGDYSVRVDSDVWNAFERTDWDNVTASTYSDPVNFSANNKSLRLSPDGRHLYIIDHLSDTIVVLAMPQLPTDTLTQVQILPDQFEDVSNAAIDIAFTPDGQFMYVSEDQTERVAVYARDTVDGTLVRKQLIYVPDIGPYAIEVAPDGRHLYVGGGYIAPFTIDPIAGTLTALAATGIPARVQDIVFNSDGTKLYAADYGNVVMRVYTRDPVTGGITQIQATDSQTSTSLSSLWSLEIADNDRDVYIASPLTDLAWHFRTLADGRLAYVGKTDLDTDGIRDLPMDLQLNPDGNILFVALGLDDAIQLLYRAPDGSLTTGPIYGTKDASITNIYENSSSLMAVSTAGDAVVRVNNRAQSIELYRANLTDALSVTVLPAAVTDADLAVTTPTPELVSISTSATSPWMGDTLQYEVTFSESVVGVDVNDFAIASSSIQGAVIDSVVGNGSSYTVTINLNAAYGQGDFSIELIDNDTIINDRSVPLAGYGSSGSVGASAVVSVDLPAPTLTSLVYANGTASSLRFTATFDQDVTGVDISDFDLEIIDAGLVGLSITSVSGSGDVYAMTVDLSAAAGQGEFRVLIKDDDTIRNGRFIPYEGFGVSSITITSDPVFVDFQDPVATSITANPSPLLSYGDLTFDVTFSEAVFNVDVADFLISSSGVVGSSIRSVTGLPDGKTFQVIVDSGSLDGSLQLLLVDNDTITDSTGRPLGGVGLVNGDLAGELVLVERNPRRNIIGHVFVDGDVLGVRDPGEPGVAGGVVYVDSNLNGQRDSGEPYSVTLDDNLGTTDVDETGSYRISNVALGQWTVRFEPDSRYLSGNFSQHDVTLTFAIPESVADLGVIQNHAAIQGRVFEDADQDGMLDAGESGLSGWTVYLDSNQNNQLDSGEPSQLTADDDPGTPEDERGSYEFSPLLLQTHRVAVIPRSDYFMTTATVADRTLGSPTSIETMNFGVTPNLTRISGAVFDDANADGVRSAGELGLANWTVFLDENLNGRWDSGEPTMLTQADDPATEGVDETGLFEFETLNLGTHIVYALVPVEYLSTSPNPVSVSFIATTDTADIRFALTTNDTTLSGIVWDDFDRDGEIDDGESGVPEATVYLDLNDNGRKDADEPSRVTGADGSYQFLHVTPGEFIVRAILPRGHERTVPAQSRPRLFLSHGNNLLREIDSLTGAQFKETAISATDVSALAFDGVSLWALDQGPPSQTYQRVLRIDPDSFDVVKTHTILADGTFGGLAAVAGSVFAIDTDSNRLYRLNAASGLLDRIWDLQTLNSGSPHLDGTLALSGAAGESVDGSAVLLETTTGRWLAVDPQTGLVTNHFDVVTQASGGLSGSTGSIYAGDAASQQVYVYDDQGNLLRTMSVGVGATGIASGIYSDTAIRVNAELDQIIDDLNFSARKYGVDISGTQFDDVNNNGVQDAGEPGLAGVTVFVDTNNNGFPDANEQKTVSAADGSYSISGLDPGTLTVRALSPQHYRPSDAYSSRQRLFGISNLHSEISNCTVLVLNEFDPQTGQVLGEFYVSQNNTTETSLTYDGQQLLLANNDDYSIAELAYDGTIINEHGMPRLLTGAPYSAFVYSTFVYVDGFLFAVSGRDAGELSLWQVDLFNNNSPDDLSTADFTLLGSIDVAGVDGRSIVSSLRASTVTTDGQSILMGSTVAAPATQQWLKIDPFTLSAVFVDDVAPTQDENGMARLGDELFIAYSVAGTTDGEIVVYDDSGAVKRTLAGFPSQKGLAGGLYRDNGMTITLGERTVTGGLDHSHFRELGSISGTLSDDANADGVITSDEIGLAGVTVYIDLNHNAQWDTGEPSAVTDSVGNYTIGGLTPDRYSVRQVAPNDRKGFAIAEPVTRLFTQATDNGVSMIYEIDPISGSVLNQFPSPGPYHISPAISLHDGELFIAKSDVLLKLDPDNGQLLETIAITPGDKDHLEIRDHVAYLVNIGQETLDQIDLLTGRVIARLDLAAINDGNPGRTLLHRSYGTAIDGDYFVIDMGTGTRSGIFKVDFRSGIIVPHTPVHNYQWAGYLAQAGGEFFSFGSSTGASLETGIFTTTDPYLTPGSVSQRRIYSPVAGIVRDYGAEQSLALQHLVWVPRGDSTTEVNFGSRPTTGTVRGIQFEDTNGNGIQDSGEPPLAGITVYVDSNANGRVEALEPQTISNADGTYTIDNAPLGMQLIRAQSPVNYRPTIISDTSNRLLGTYRLSDTASPTGFVLQLREVDPVTGLMLSVTTTSIPIDQAYSAAYDGHRVILVDNSQDTLLEIALDGTLLDQVPLPGIGSSTVFSQGPVVIDGTIYLMTSGGGMPLQLIRYNAETNEFYGAMPISRYIDPTNELDPLPQFSLSMSESPDGKSILAFSNIDARVFVIDPLTAKMTSVLNLPRTDGGDWSAAAVGGELFVRSAGSQSNIDVYDSQYNRVRTLGNPATSGMGGGVYKETALPVTVMAGIDGVNVNFGHRSTLSTISGSVLDDSNKNRSLDSGERSADGVRVYLDTNRNGMLDNGERSTTTSSDGTYVFEDLVAGDYTVRVDQPASVKVLTDRDSVELFSLEVAQGASTIRKYDPITGELLREFPAPGASTTAAGLALDDSGLFYSANSTLWKLDPESGLTLDSMQLPTGYYSGLAVIAGQVIAVDAATELLYKINGITMQVVATIDVNTVNAPGPTGIDFQESLGESSDGTRLITRLSSGGGTIVLDPQTGIVDQSLPTNLGTPGISGVGGEIFRAYGDQIRVESLWEGFIRNVPTVERSYGIGASSVPSREHSVRTAPDIDHVELNFFQQLDRPSSISGILWNDSNANGLIDQGEELLENRTVFLDANDNRIRDDGEDFVVTLQDDPATTDINEAGHYRFDDVAPGNHDVVQVLPAGWRQTYPFAGAFDVLHVVDNGYVPGQNSGTNPFYDSSISDGGTFIAFSTYNALLPEDTNNEADIYVLDTDTDQLELISVSSEEMLSNGRSLSPLISADGRHVVFWSYSDNFVANDNNNTQDIFVRDRQLGVTTLVSAVDPTLSTGSSTGNSYSYSPGFSDDGRYVTFWSNSTDLVPGDTNGLFDLFLRDLELGTTERINLAPDGGQASGGNTHNSHVSADGRFVAYWSWADNLVAGDTNGVSDAFVLDRQTGITERVSVTATGVQSDANVHNVSISDDGRYVVFHSNATTLDDVPGAGGTQVYLKDRTTGQLRMIGRDAAGFAPNQSAVLPLISGDGRWVVFNSWANNLDENDPDGGSDAFLYDRVNDTVKLLSRSITGDSGNGRTDWVQISNDGSTVTFNSAATNLTSASRTGGHLYSVNLEQLTADVSWHTVTVAANQSIFNVDFGSLFDPIAPSDIVLSDSTINENSDVSTANLLVAVLATVDSDTPSGHVYELVSGTDDTDNAKFSVQGDQLMINQGQIVDYETQSEYRVRLKTTDVTGQSFEKAVRVEVVDLAEMQPIEIAGGTSQRSSIVSIDVKFDTQVEVDAGAFLIRHREASGDVDVLVSLDHSGGKTTATLTFSGMYADVSGSLIAGNYELTIDGAKIRSTANGMMLDGDGDGIGGGLYRIGDEEADGFFRLLGDSDGDRDVDAQDYGRFAQTFLKRKGQIGFDETFDSDGDGDVDGQDYAQLRQRFLRSMRF